MNAATTWAHFWWILLPYISMVVFVLGHIWRWRYDRFGWTSYSTELQEKSWLKWGAPLFHYGTFAAIASHVMGIMIPKAWTDALGISEHAYHVFAAGAGLLAAALVIVGMCVLAARRLFVPRVKSTTSPVDWVALVLLGIMVVLGIAVTVWNVPQGHAYRETIAIWFRGLFTASADVETAQEAPLIFEIHAIAAWLLFMIWPFTRLVHAWSYPLWYLWRPYIVYRSRVPARSNEPGTSGRRWRKIGAKF